MTTLAAMGPPPKSYARRLFEVQYNLILLGGSALFSLASASFVPLAVGLGLEALLLALGPNLAGVRRWLDERNTAGTPSVEDSVARSVRDSLDPSYASRVQSLERVLDELLALAPPDPAERAVLTQRLDALGATFARLCETHQRLSRFVATVPEAELNGELERLKQAFSAEKDLALRLAIRQAMGVTQRRLEQRSQMVSALRTAALRLETLERAVGGLRTRGRTLGANRELFAETDVLLAEFADGQERAELQG